MTAKDTTSIASRSARNCRRVTIQLRRAWDVSSDSLRTHREMQW